MKNIGFKLLFIVYILFLIADFTMTSMVKHKEVLEANIIYDYVGFTGIILVNCIIAWLLWWLYSRPSATPGARFMLIMCMLMVIAMRIYALNAAWFYIQNPVTLQHALEIATPQAMKETTKKLVAVAYPPFLMGLLGYIIWRIDHNVRRKE